MLVSNPRIYDLQKTIRVDLDKIKAAETARGEKERQSRILKVLRWIAEIVSAGLVAAIGAKKR